MKKENIHISLLRVRLFAVIGLVCGWVTIGCGQDHHDRLVLPDLELSYADASSSSERALILYDLALYYQVKNYQVDSILYFADRLLELADKEEYPIAEVLGERMLGAHYSTINQFGRAKKHLHKSLQVAHSIDYMRYIHDTYNLLARSNLKEGALDSALYYYHKCLEITPTDMHSKYSNFHGGIAVVYAKLGREDQQAIHLHKSYERSKMANIRLDQIIALTGLLDYYTLVERDPVIFNKYKKPYDSLCMYYPSMSKGVHSNSMFFDSIPQDHKIQFVEAALEDNISGQYVDGVFYNYIQLQKEYLDRKDYESCVEISKKAIAYNAAGNAQQLEILIEIYHNKLIAEKELDLPEEALETAMHYQYLKDSMQIVTNAQYVNELSIKYETAKKDQALAESASRVVRRTAQRNNVILGAGVLLIIGFYLWRRLRYKQKQIEIDNKLKAERIENLEKEKRILSLTSMLEGQEAERVRIAQDLHDGLGGLLSSVRNHFSMINEEMLKIDSLQIYDRTNTMIDQACNEVRRISHNLMPASLQLNGLVSTLRQYCDDVESSKGIAVQFEHVGPQGVRLEETVEIFLYRIAQECISNVLKHAQAENLLVQLVHSVREITLVVEDDGVGFDASSDYAGIGLHSIRSRVSHLRGELDIDSRIGQGTTITINIIYEQ